MRTPIIRFTLFLLSLLPMRLAHGLGGMVGWLFYRIPNRVSGRRMRAACG